MVMMLIRTAAADSCYPINSAQIIFGNYSPEFSQALDMDTTIEIYCAPAFQGQQLNVRVNLIDQTDQGNRRVLQNTSGDDKAYYILFQDAARTIPLSDDMAIPVTESVPRSKLFTIRLYGRLLAKQNISKGIYVANLIVNIDY
jgi:spore coat protein U-like protein